MARKSVVNLVGSQDRIDEAVEEFKFVSEVKGDLARKAYDAQDADTQDMIGQMLSTLRVHATGYINVQLAPPEGAVVPVKIEQQYVDFNLLYIVMDVLKNLALFDIKVGSYTFPDTICASCEAELTVSEAKPRKGLKR